MSSLFAHSVFGTLPHRAYGVILADPPWRFQLYSERGEEKSPQAHYDTMTEAEIAALPVRDLADPAGCAVVMWCTAPGLEIAMRTLRAWGFRYSSAGAWAKRSRSDESWTFGTGYRYRSAAEFWLLGILGQPRQTSNRIRNLIVAPVREHSRKPSEMHVALQEHFQGPYLELFAREQRPGWDAWGNEVGRFPAAHPEDEG